MSYLDWKVGDRVVLVDCSRLVQFNHKGWRKFIPGLGKFIMTHQLVVGETYEIEAVTTHNDLTTGEPIVCIFVKGFRFNEHKGVAFPAAWFRKVQPRKTDISIFEAILHGARVPEDA